MIRIEVRRDGRRRLSSFLATGHAGWWAGEGADPVCAAVSTLLQSAWLGLSEVLEVEVRGERASGYLKLSWPAAERGRSDVRAVTETTARALERLAQQFPKAVRIIDEPVTRRAATGKPTAPQRRRRS